MKRRVQSWQAEKARTAKALRELPRCETEGCDGRGMGLLAVAVQMGPGEVVSRPAWLCVKCAAKARNTERQKVRNQPAPRSGT